MSDNVTVNKSLEKLPARSSSPSKSSTSSNPSAAWCRNPCSSVLLTAPASNEAQESAQATNFAPLRVRQRDLPAEQDAHQLEHLIHQLAGQPVSTRNIRSQYNNTRKGRTVARPRSATRATQRSLPRQLQISREGRRNVHGRTSGGAAAFERQAELVLFVLNNLSLLQSRRDRLELRMCVSRAPCCWSLRRWPSAALAWTG